MNNELKFREDSWFGISWILTKFQLIRTTNKKVLFLKIICGMLLFETLNKQKSDFLNSNMCFYSRLYGTWFCMPQNDTPQPKSWYNPSIRELPIAMILLISLFAPTTHTDLLFGKTVFSQNDMKTTQI